MVKIYNNKRELVCEVTVAEYLEFGITEPGFYAVVDTCDEAPRKDIGTLNGFYDNPPAEWENHIAKCSKVRSYTKNLGRCYNEYYCPLCGVVYRVDSSD